MPPDLVLHTVVLATSVTRLSNCSVHLSLNASELDNLVIVFMHSGVSRSDAVSCRIFRTLGGVVKFLHKEMVG